VEDLREMSPSLVVLKVGGSLLDWPGLPSSLARDLDLRQAMGQRLLLLTGGGGAADFIRTLDRTFTLGDDASHRLAMRSLDLTAHILAALVPHLDVIDAVPGLEPLWAAGRIPILAPRGFLEEDDLSSPDPLPHSWDVTSDTIAARVAVHLGADALCLLKSTPSPPGTTRREAARIGLVDPHFPDASRELDRVFYVNYRGNPRVSLRLPP